MECSAYLKGTIDVGLCYEKGDTTLTAYADADFGNCVVDRMSFTGYVFILSGAAVSWRSRKQRTVTVADSTTFAEYVSISECGKEGVYLKGLICEVFKEQRTVTIFNDNQGANKLCNNSMTHNRSKHIDVKYHQIRRWVEKGIVVVNYLPDSEMIADIFTKALNGPKHKFCMAGIGIG